MKIDFRVQWKEIAGALLLYAIVLVYQGYQYGQGDQSQILPCIWAMGHAPDYTCDFYVQSYLQAGFNERSIFHFLFRFLGYQFPWIVWVWHLALSFALIFAWIRITSFFIKNISFQWLTLAMILVIGFHTSTGSNEIYYNSVIPSLAAKAAGSWALVYWLTSRFTRWSLLLILATLLQPLVGLQLFILTVLAYILDLLAKKFFQAFPWRAVFYYLPWRAFLYYLVVIVPFFILLIRNNGSEGEPSVFFDIIQFRLSHHFFASSFGILHLALFFIFSLLAIYLARERLRWFIVLILFGCLVYEIGTEYAQVPLVLYTQWWKTTIWLEAFAFIGIGIYLEKLFSPNSIINRFPFIVPAVLLLMVSVYRLGIRDVKPPYMFPWSKEVSDEVDISLQAFQNTPADAVFIVPKEFTAFRWYSKRCTYIDYKAMLHQQSFLNEWYRRIKSIYQFGKEEKEGGFDINIFSYYLLHEPSPMSIEFWKKLGITHIVSTNPGVKGLTLVARNGQYAIYAL